MTGQLRYTLRSRADQLEAWSPDLDSLVAAGERRRRRNRRSAVVGLAATLLVTVGGVAAVRGLGRDTAEVPSDQSAVPLTYAVGNVIHSGEAQLDVGLTVHSLVRLSDGFVFSAPNGRVYLWRDGDRHSLGHLASPTTRLYGSDDGFVAAWWDGRHIQTWPGYRSESDVQTIQDDKTAELTVARSWPKRTPPRVEALAGGHVWWWTGRQHSIAEVRPAPTTATWPDTNPPGSASVVDAAGHHVLARTTAGMTVAKANLLPWPVGKQDNWHPGGDLAGLATQVHGVTSGDLAPNGRRWFATDRTDTNTNTISVFDAANGDQQTIRYNGDQITPYAWLGDDTIAAWTVSSDSSQGLASLLTCRVSTSTCTVVAPDVAPIDALALADSSR